MRKLNGIYEHMEGETVNGRRSYVLKRGLESEYENLVLWSWTQKLKGKISIVWMISREEHVGTQNAYACVQTDHENPAESEHFWMVFKGGTFVQSAMTVDGLPENLSKEAVDVLKGTAAEAADAGSDEEQITPREALEKFTFLRFRNNFEDDDIKLKDGDELYCGGRFRLLNLGDKNELTYDQVERCFDDMGITVRGAMDEAFSRSQEADGTYDTVKADTFHMYYLSCEQKHILRRFRAVDVGDDGFICQDDLNIVLVAMGVPKEDVEDIERMAAQFMNGDGLMNYEAFLEWYYMFQRRQTFRGQLEEEIENYSDTEYDGPNILSPKSIENSTIDVDVKKIYDQLRAGKGLQGVDSSGLQTLCKKAFKTLRMDSTVLDINGNVTIVGDIHGQYFDLCRIFNRCGDPGKQIYLFLGDYVDRGDHSLEVMTLLFACKILYPDNFFLLRGNHEDSKINSMYGFLDECKERFDVKAFKFFNTCFCMMPFCAIVNNELFCVHAGISPSFENLEQIRKIQRPCRIEPGITCDLVWSDPSIGKRKKKFSANRQRGTSYKYSRRATEEFLRDLDLKRIVRAHELCDYGYQIEHNGKLFTIFSAPNYCGECDNRGAVMKVYEDLTASIMFLDPLGEEA